MTARRAAAAAAVVLGAAAAAACARGGEAAADPDRREARRERAAPAGEPAPVAAGGLCVTRGGGARDGARLAVTEPVVRAVAPGAHGDAATLRFTYHGPTDEAVRLASGQVRRQLGLKLRSEDGCNLVYVMWRIEPGPGIEVQVKRNRGKRTHAACGSGGYTKVKPRAAAAAPALAPGSAHALDAAIAGDDLVVRIDGEVVWEGRLPDAARELAGPPGLRTDNVVADLELVAAPAGGPQAANPGCPDDSD